MPAWVQAATDNNNDLIECGLDFHFFFAHNNHKELSMALTKRQKEVLDFIAGFVDENRMGPLVFVRTAY